MATFTEDFDDSTDIDEHLGSEIVSGELRPEDLDEGTCLTLDGTADYGHTADAAEWTFNTGGADDPFSVSGWYYIRSFTGNPFTFAKSDATVTTAVEWLITIVTPEPGDVYFAVYESGDYTIVRGRIANASVPLNEWVHIVCTYNGNEAVTGFAIYLNGLRVDDADYTAGTYTGMGDTAEPLTLGARGHLETPERYLDADIKEQAIHSVELTAQEVLKLYQTNDDDQSANLVGHWKFNEGSGTTVDNDEGTASRDLTLVSTPPWSTTHPSFFARRTRTTSGNLL